MTDAGSDTTPRRLFSSVVTLLDSVGLSRMMDSVDVNTVPVPLPSRVEENVR